MSLFPIQCTHDLTDREVACADGMCPICLARALRMERGRVRELEADLNTDADTFNRLLAERDALRESNERLRGLLDRVVTEVGRTITSELRGDIDAALAQKEKP